MKGRPTFSKFYYYFAFSMDDGPLIAAGSAGSSHLPTLTRFDSKLMESRGYCAVCSCTVSAAQIQQFWVWALAGPLRMSSLFLYVRPVFFMYSGQSNISQQIQYRNRWKNPAASIKPDITKLAKFLCEPMSLFWLTFFVVVWKIRVIPHNIMLHMLACDDFVIFKSIKIKKIFSVLVSNMVNIDTCAPRKKELFGGSPWWSSR